MYDEEKEFLIKNIVVNAKRIKEDLEIEVAKKEIVAKKGDWLVTMKNGKKMVIDKEKFDRDYILLEDNLSND